VNEQRKPSATESALGCADQGCRVMDLSKIAQSIEAFTGAFDIFKNKNDAEIRALIERLEEIEARGDRPGRTGSNASTAAAREHKKRFEAWLRKPYDAGTRNALSEFQSREGLEQRGVTIGTPAGGGYAVPEEISREVEKLELQFSPVRSLIKVQRVGTSDFKSLVNIRGATSGWVGETDARTATDTSQLRERVPTHGEIFAYPECTEWSMDDLFFNVADWLAEEAAQSFAIEEGDAVIRGNGTNKPTGMLTTTPTTAADFASPMRNAAAYMYLASPSLVSPTVYGIDPDKLIDMVYSLNAIYRAGAAWAMNSSTAGAIAKLKDSEGRYVWRESLVSGQPATLLGYPVAIWEQLDDIGANNFPVAFGNFRRAYTLAERTDLRITTDNITTPGRVKFYIRRREGGCVTNNNALRWLRTTA
jgi:HK97 family phage major capsid protein